MERGAFLRISHAPSPGAGSSISTFSVLTFNFVNIKIRKIHSLTQNDRSWHGNACAGGARFIRGRSATPLPITQTRRAFYQRQLNVLLNGRTVSHRADFFLAGIEQRTVSVFVERLARLLGVISAEAAVIRLEPGYDIPEVLRDLTFTMAIPISANPSTQFRSYMQSADEQSFS